MKCPIIEQKRQIENNQRLEADFSGEIQRENSCFGRPLRCRGKSIYIQHSISAIDRLGTPVTRAQNRGRGILLGFSFAARMIETICALSRRYWEVAYLFGTAFRTLP